MANVTITDVRRTLGVYTEGNLTINNGEVGNPVTQNLTDGATITMNIANGKWGRVTLGGNRTLVFENLVTGTAGLIFVYQDNTGGRTLSYPGNSEIPTGGLDLSAGPGELTVIGYIYDGANILFTKENYGVAVAPELDVVPPAISTAVVQEAAPTHIVITFSESVLGVSATGWSFKKNGLAWNISSVSGSGSIWTFVMDSPAGLGDGLLRSYNSVNGSTIDLQSNELVSFVDYPVTNNVTTAIADIIPPEVLSATVENDSPSDLVVVFNEPVTGVSTSGFSFKKNGVSWVADSVSGSGTTWTFVMATAAANGDVLLRSYAGSTVVDTATNAMASFTDVAVTNNVAISDVTAPTVVSATVEDADQDTVVVVFSEAVTGVSSTGWSFKKNGGAWAISTVTGSGTTWNFNMASAAVFGDTLLRSYDSTTGATVDAASNELVTFTDSAVTNNVALVLTPLSTPTLTLTVLSDTSIQADWTNVANESSYVLQRSPDNSAWTTINSPAANITTYTDTGLAAATLYFYRIRAIGDGVTYSDSGYGTDSDTTSAAPVDEYLTYIDIASTDNQVFNADKGIRKYQTTAAPDYTFATQAFEDGDVIELLLDAPTIANNVQVAEVSTGDVAASSKFRYNINGFNHRAFATSVSSNPSTVIEEIPATSGDLIRFVKKSGTIYISVKLAAWLDWMVLHRSYVTTHAATNYLSFTLASINKGFSEVVKKAITAPNDYPDYFTARALTGNASVQLSWDAVAGATGYVVERADNLTFTTNKTEIYSGALLTYTNTGLTASTKYYFRVKATFASGGDSPWYWNTATTSANGEYAAMRFPTSGTKMEPMPDFRGYRKKFWSDAAEAIYSYSPTDMAAGEAIGLKLSATGEIVHLAFNTVNTVDPSGTTNIIKLRHNGAYAIAVFEGATSVYTETAAINNQFRLANRSNGTYTVDKSTDGGATWTTVYTSGLTASGAYKVGIAATNQGWGSPLIYRMTGL